MQLKENPKKLCLLYVNSNMHNLKKKNREFTVKFNIKDATKEKNPQKYYAFCT